MAATESTGAGEQDRSQQTGMFARCGRCQMEVRRSEMDMHLAHAHNIGVMPSKKDKRRDGRGRRSR